MNKKNMNPFSKIVISLCLLVAMTCFYSGISFINYNKVCANYTPESVTVSNANFSIPTGTSNSTYPLSATNWTSSSSNSYVTNGIINIDDDIFDAKKTDYNLTFNPLQMNNTTDNQILMINASSDANFGYTSNSFTLSKNSYYVIKFNVYTQETAFASAYIKGDYITDIAQSEKESISTNGSWQEFRFLVKTDSINSTSVQLSVWLGTEDGLKTSGAVFFDNVLVKKYTNEQYNDIKSNLTSGTYNEVVANSRIVSGAITSGDFETSLGNNALTNWTKLTSENSTDANVISGVQFIGEGYDSVTTGIEENPNNAYLSGNTKALLINNVGYNTIGYSSANFTINQHMLYKLSFKAKTNDINGSATAKLISNNIDDSEDFTITTVSTDSIDTSSLTDSVNGDWIEYSFYIVGDVFDDTSVHLEFWLGTESANALGYIWIDNVKLEKVTTSEYDSNYNSTRTKSVDLSSTITSSPSVSNGFFNQVMIEELSDTYPLAADGWTITSNNELLTKDGVFNTNATQFTANSSNYTFDNPLSIRSSNTSISNNVLMLGNIADTYQVAKCDTAFTLGASSYYKFSFDIQTQDLVNGYAKVYLTDANGVEFATFYDIVSDRVWADTYTVYIKTGIKSYSAYVNLALGSSQVNATGYAFYDNVKFETSTEEVYNNANKKVDISKEYFNMYEHHSTSMTNGVYAPYNYTASKDYESTSDDMIIAGVLDVENMTDTHPLYASLGGNPSSANGEKNVLLISSQDDTIYKYTSKNTYSLTSGNYYKVSVYAKTLGISQDSENAVEDEDYGFTIKLSNINKLFDAIKSSNDYVEYVFYINAESAITTSFIFSLGRTDALTKGYALISSANIETLDEQTFVAAVASTSNSATTLQIGSTDIDTETDDEDDDTTTVAGGFDWLLVPTIITCLALIIAIIAYSTKKMKLPKKAKKVGPTNYDRDKTIKKEAIRKEKLNKVIEQKNALEKQLNKLQEKYLNASKIEKTKLETKIIEIKTKIKITEKDINTLSYKKSGK